MDQVLRDEIVGRLAATEGMVLGEYAAAIVRFSQVIGSATAAVGTKILALGNLAVALNETGRLSRAEEAARRALDLCNIDSEDAQPVLYHKGGCGGKGCACSSAPCCERSCKVR